MLPILSKWPSRHLGSFILRFKWPRARAVWPMGRLGVLLPTNERPGLGQHCWPVAGWPSPVSPVLTDPVTLATLAFWAPSDICWLGALSVTYYYWYYYYYHFIIITYRSGDTRNTRNILAFWAPSDTRAGTGARLSVTRDTGSQHLFVTTLNCRLIELLTLASTPCLKLISC